MNLFPWGFLICRWQQEAPGARATTVRGLVCAITNLQAVFYAF